MFELTRAGRFQWIAFLAGVACAVCVFETIYEIHWKSSHPYTTTNLPEVIAYISGAGALLALCVVLLAKTFASDAIEVERRRKQKDQEAHERWKREQAQKQAERPHES
jgi:hypothetical protein